MSDQNEFWKTVREMNNAGNRAVESDLAVMKQQTANEIALIKARAEHVDTELMIQSEKNKAVALQTEALVKVGGYFAAALTFLGVLALLLKAC